MNKMAIPKIENIGFIGILIIVALIFFYLLLGFSAAMAIFWVILFIAPIYLILNNFEISQDEKLIFSFFISVGVLPSMAYWLGGVISLKAATLISFAILLVIAFLVGLIFPQTKHSPSQNQN